MVTRYKLTSAGGRNRDRFLISDWKSHCLVLKPRSTMYCLSLSTEEKTPCRIQIFGVKIWDKNKVFCVYEGCIVRQTAVGHLIRYFYSPSISEDIFYPVRETSPAFPWIGWPWLCSNLHFRNLLEKETERINFRKDFWGCYWRQGKQIDQ